MRLRELFLELDRDELSFEHLRSISAEMERLRRGAEKAKELERGADEERTEWAMESRLLSASFVAFALSASCNLGCAALN